jgi:hypothetical protein
MKKRIEFVKKALEALGGAYRNDWSQVDGRTLKAQLEKISSYLDGDKPLPGFDEWMLDAGIEETKYGYDWIE